MATPLWELRLEELGLPTMVLNVLRETWHAGWGLTKAWHVAVLCDRCLLLRRQLGRKSLQQTRACLRAHGFPPAPVWCAGTWRDTGRGNGYDSVCRRDLETCRATLEPGTVDAPRLW